VTVTKPAEAAGPVLLTVTWRWHRSVPGKVPSVSTGNDEIGKLVPVTGWGLSLCSLAMLISPPPETVAVVVDCDWSVEATFDGYLDGIRSR